MKNILFISASPRDGNTQKIITRIISQITIKNCNIEFIKLNEKNINNCNGCFNCDSTAQCVKEDDMIEILNKIKSSDIVVLGTPSYFYNVTGLCKNFIDKLHPFYENSTISGKKFIFIYLGGAPAEINLTKLSACISGTVDCLELDNIGEFAFSAQERDEWFESESEITNKIVKIVNLIKLNLN